MFACACSATASSWCHACTCRIAATRPRAAMRRYGSIVGSVWRRREDRHRAGAYASPAHSHNGLARATDDEFLPSGEWTGFFQQGRGKYRTDLVLTFAGGRMHGSGSDWVGPFTVRGRYDVGTGELNWVKTYVGAHDVYYRGFRERRSVWGVWEIPGHGRSGFKIWPRGEGEGEGIEQAAALEAPPVRSVQRAHSAS